ncbi:hypothetical protein ACHAXR_010895 [Thalassiosira sp. AJA248-18]
MDQFGSDLADADGQTIEKRKEQRIKRGECPTCRRKTHKVSRFPFGSTKREPLTVEGEVINGHCLRCRPVEGYMRRAPDKPAIPETLEVPSPSGTDLICEEDDMTVASEITMDPFLTAGPIVDGNRRYSSSVSRPHLMASHFESVSEETPITDFGRHAEEVAGHIDQLQHERRERERDIVREQESRVVRGRQGNNLQYDQQPKGGERILEEDSEESEEEDELWENHEHLLRRMEQQHQQQRQQQQQQHQQQQQQNHQFHPLAVQHNFSNSEQSISITDERETPKSPIVRHEETKTNHNNSSSGSGSAYKQNFHPSAKIAEFSNSELSMSLPDEISHASASASMQSGDSGIIQRLCQGSRSSLTMEKGQDSRSSLMMERENEKSLMRDSSPMMKHPPKEGDRLDNSSHKHRGTNRFSLCLKRLSTSSQCSDDEKEEKGRKKGGQKESNRFSLNLLDSKGRKVGREKEPNRFSLNLNQIRPPAEMPPNLIMEMNNSKNWDSMDILRDAAAEANGGDLDAEVDALFGITGGTILNEGPTPTPRFKQTISSLRESMGTHDTSANSTEGELDYEGEVNIMANVLSREPSAHEEAALATTITQRRQSGPSEGNLYRMSSIKDIPVIIQAVKSRPNDKKCTERAFQSLFLLATDPGPDGSIARKEILEKGGMETLVLAMWDHIKSRQVLLALFHALWAISVFNGNDEKSSEASISKIQECGVLGGLLFAIRSHAEDLSIQESGCDLITRLTGLLPTDTPEFTSAVALLSTNIQGLNTETKAYSSCLDALYSLCQLSDTNKREFAKAGNGCYTAIIRGLTSSDSPSLETQELACQLLWCTTSDRTAVSKLSLNGVLSENFIDALRSVPRAKSSVHVYGAACGTLANFALEPNNHGKMIDLGVVPILCEAIYVYDFSIDVNSAACTALANLSASRDIRNTIASQGGIPALFSAIKSTSDNADVQSEAFRALHNLCELSSDGKHAIVADLEIIITSFSHHEGVKYVQQITCSILCRLSADKKCRESMIMLPGTFDALAKIMKSNPRKKMVQKAACSTLRNLSKEESIIPILLSKGFDSLVIDAMDSYSDCEELQENACTFLMNMGSYSPEVSVKICSGKGIHCLVKTMQTIPTSSSVQQASCGALHAITKGDAHKSMAISAGVVDAIIYLMLVHPNENKVLENAVNVLTNLSSLKKCTKTIADAGGISTVIETMRSNPTSTGLILSGSRFIQNMALSDSEYANEALGGITPILGCMDEHPACAKLVEESCKALRCLVLKSESCKDRVINADGVAVIEKTMEENITSQRWQTLLLDELFE